MQASLCSRLIAAFFILHSSFFILEWSESHAARGGNRRQERCERGYYHLHRNLNQSCFFHNCQLSIVNCQLLMLLAVIG
jgi:hypothetical protein